MNTYDAHRELTMVLSALQWAYSHLCKKAEANAALHVNNTVMYPPLVAELHQALDKLSRVLTALEAGPIEEGAGDVSGTS